MKRESALFFLFVLLLSVFVFSLVFPHARVILGINPVQGNQTASSNVTFDFKGVSNVSINSIQLFGDWNGTWVANYTNNSYVNNTWLNITVEGIHEGNHTWGVLVNNTEGYLNWSLNRSFIVDLTAPFFVSLTNQTGFSNESFSYDIDATDSLVGLGNFSLNDTSVFSINSTTGLIENITSLINGGFFVYNLTINDSLGNLNWTVFTINITKVHYPMIFLGNPVYTFNTSNSSVIFEFRVVGNTTIDTIQIFGDWNGTWMANYTNYTNLSYSSGDWLNITVEGINEGNYNWSVYANESDGNFTWSINKTFTVDLTAPTITVVSPEDNSDYTENDVDFSLITNEPSICYYDLDIGEGNVSMSANATNNGFTGTENNLENGDYDPIFYCFDYAGNLKVDSSISFGVDVASEVVTTTETTTTTTSTSESTLTTADSENESEENDYLISDIESFLNENSSENEEREEELNPSIKLKKPFFKKMRNSFLGNSIYSFKIKLKDFELGNSSEALINYTIKDYEGNIYLEESEIKNIEGVRSYRKDFILEDFPKGEYTLETKVLQAGEIQEVESNFKFNPKTSLIIAIIFGIFIVLLAIAFFVFTKIMKKKNMKKYVKFVKV
jgi:hypothetical protein